MMFIHTYEDNNGWNVAAFSLSVEQTLKIKFWCQETYGRSTSRWKDDLIYGEARFASKDDLLLFTLRWG